MTSNPIAIRVENLSKRYRIGIKEEMQDSFVATAIEFIKSPLNNYKKYRSLYNFEDVSELGFNKNNNSADIIWALKDISFDVGHGEVVGIIGRNGAGKSTLLKILSKITNPTSGNAEIRGRISSLLEVGTGFHPELTGRENIYLNGTILGMTKKEVDQKFSEIVDFSGVEKFIDTPVKRFSSGMKVRLAFSVAAHLEPEILLVDEVLAVGDISFQKKCLGKMENVGERGRSVLFVSHNMAAIESLCSRAIYLENGKNVFDGPAKEAVQRYIESIQEYVDKQNLFQRTDRVGGDQFRFKNVEFLNPKTMSLVKTLVSGQELLIRLTYFCGSKETLNDVMVSIVFTLTSGVFLFACRSETVGKPFSISNGEGYLYCKIPKFPLKPGRYAYNLFANMHVGVLDWVKDAGYFDVEAGDYYGTGKLPAPNRQGVLIDFDWQPQPEPKK